jgi:hypothetical protein
MRILVVPVKKLLAAAVTAGSACALAAGIMPSAALAQRAGMRGHPGGHPPPMGERIHADPQAPVTSDSVSTRVYLGGKDRRAWLPTRSPSPRRITRFTASIRRRRR